jgi:hypothetical protein
MNKSSNTTVYTKRRITEKRQRGGDKKGKRQRIEGREIKIDGEKNRKET